MVVVLEIFYLAPVPVRRRFPVCGFLLKERVNLKQFPVSLPVSFIMADFLRCAVDVSAVVWQVEGQTPCACCVVCPSNGSRTVVLSDT